MLEKYYWELLAKKLAGEATRAELEEFHKLLEMFPHLQSSISPLEEIWQTKVQEDQGDTELQYDVLMSRFRDFESRSTGASPTKRLSKTKIRLISFSAAAAVVILFFSIYANFSGKDNGQFNTRIDTKMQTRQFVCPPGSKTKIVLPDSSTVWLNSGTKLTYNDDYGTNNRDVTLIGEAFFDVRKSETPFIIKTANIKIKVLGTAFNVRAYPHEKRSETSLLRGSVEVTLDERPNQRIVLKPSEKIVVNNNGNSEGRTIATVQQPLIVLSGITKTNDSTIAETLWVENKLIFRSETFEALSKKMEARYGVKIVFKDESLKQQRFTGAFTNESITEMLEALQFSHAFFYSIHDNIIEISTND